MPGEGWGGGLEDSSRAYKTPTLTLPRSTGGGNQAASLLSDDFRDELKVFALDARQIHLEIMLQNRFC